MAARVGSGDEAFDCVTAEFRLDYRRPVPSETGVRVRARLLRSEGRSYFVAGEILGTRDDEILTRAEARWVRLRRDTPAGGAP